MRIGVFGDVHGNLAALQAVLADGKARQVDQWVCLGDVAFKGPKPVECINTIREQPNLTQIVGNTDQWLYQGFPPGFAPPPARMQQLEAFRAWCLERLGAEELAYLRSRPFCHEIALDGKKVLFVHSSPASTEDWLPAGASEQELAPLVTGHSADIVVYGHIHNGYIRQVSGRLVMNTGSTGNPIDGDNRAAYLVLTAEEGAVSYELRRVPYAWVETAAAAQAAGMPYAAEYAKALETGSAL